LKILLNLELYYDFCKNEKEATFIRLCICKQFDEIFIHNLTSMVQTLILLLLLICLKFNLSSSFIIPPIKFHKKVLFKKSINKIFALKEGAYLQLNNLKQEYEDLQKIMYNKQPSNKEAEALSKRIKELTVVFKCVAALEEIEQDLKMCSEHESGEDESLKKTAKVFKKEFTQCKELIESQLNNLLGLN
jgi:hypothetical protein